MCRAVRIWSGRSGAAATAIPNVEVVHAGVTEPTFDAALLRVTGVRLDTGEQIPADLVVDSTGRGTRLPVWLEQWGFERPPEGSVDVGISYATPSAAHS